MSVVKTVTKPADEASSSTGGDKPDAQKSPVETTKATDVAPSVPLSGAHGADQKNDEAKKASEEAELNRMLAEEAELDRSAKAARDRFETAERLAAKRKERDELDEKAAKLEQQNLAAARKSSGPDAAAGDALREEIAKGEAVEREAVEAGHQAREDELARQGKTTDSIDWTKVEDAEKRSIEKVRARARGKRGPGVYILSPLEVMGPSGRTTLPKSSRMPDGIAQSYNRDALRQLEVDGVVEDLR
jgi:hypothetical protein